MMEEPLRFNLSRMTFPRWAQFPLWVVTIVLFGGLAALAARQGDWFISVILVVIAVGNIVLYHRSTSETRSNYVELGETSLTVVLQTVAGTTRQSFKYRDIRSVDDKGRH
jgi:uncharacterized membrane protein YdbT with pleckstrin-like domain